MSLKLCRPGPIISGLMLMAFAGCGGLADLTDGDVGEGLPPQQLSQSSSASLAGPNDAADGTADPSGPLAMSAFAPLVPNLPVVDLPGSTVIDRLDPIIQLPPVSLVPQEPEAVKVIDGGNDVIQVKFHDGLGIRLLKNRRDPDDRGMLHDVDGKALASPKAKSVMEKLAPGEWERAHVRNEEELDYLRQVASKRTGEDFPDLNLYFSYRVPKELDPRDAIKMLEELEEVYRAWPMPDYYLADAPNYTQPQGTDGFGDAIEYQKYIEPAADPNDPNDPRNGVNAQFAWGVNGGDGSGVRIVDIESAYNANHSEMPFITDLGPPPAQAPSSFSINHGTATWGVIGGLPDGVGVTGIAHASDKYFVTQLAYHLQYGAIGWAIGLDGILIDVLLQESLDLGDVILLELQTSGPVDLMPVEWNEQIFQALRIGTANGVVIVEAAGNGYQNLDSYIGHADAPHDPFAVDGQGQRENDSGAIMVGAGYSGADWSAYNNGLHEPRERLGFSNYGARVDVQGWGDAVMTSGQRVDQNGNVYATETPYEPYDPDEAYTRAYGGTSGASAILGGVVTALQGAYKAHHGEVLTAQDMRQVLIATGTPQNGSDHIGPLPDMRAFIEALIDLDEAEPAFELGPEVNAAPYCENTGTEELPLPQFSVPSGMIEGDEPVEVKLLFGDVTIAGAQIWYTLDGAIPTICNDPVPQCYTNSQLWTPQDLLNGNSITIDPADLPVRIIARMTTTACGTFAQPVGDINIADYVPYSDIPAPIIHFGDGPVEHQESRVLSPQDLFDMSAAGILEDGQLCVKFDFNGAGGSPYIRYTLDGSNPVDTTNDGSIGPEDASPIWTDFNISQGQCIPVLSWDDPPGTMVTVKAQNFAYFGTGEYIGGAIAVETYMLDY